MILLRLLLLLAPFCSLFCNTPGISLRPMVEMEGMPDSFYHGCVNVISGGYCDYELDVTIPGPLPLKLERSYSSSALFGSNDGNSGWSDLCKAEMHYKWRANLLKKDDLHGVYCSELSGTTLYYDCWIEKQGSNKIKLAADPEKFQVGFTNCAAEVMSGRTHLKNNCLIFSNKQETCLVTTGSGEQRFYNRLLKDNNYRLLDRMRKPNGNIMRWSYNKEHSTRCWTCDAGGSHEYASVVYDQNHWQRVVKASDGRERIASYMVLKDRDNGRDWWYLANMVRSDKPTVHYEYDQSYDHKGTYPLIQKNYPDQRALKISYYKAGTNHVHGEQVKLTGNSKEKNRVSALYAPVGKDASLIPIGLFIYNVTPEGMQTRVWDALDHQTNYISDHKERLSKISYFEKVEGGQACKREEFFSWSGDGSLLSAEYVDRTSPAYQRINYAYDCRGNVLAKTVTGCFTGRVNHSEQITYRYSYSGEMNLLVSQMDPSGLVTATSYYPGTDLVQSRLVKSGGEILRREFLRYNGDAVLIEQISDDGSGVTLDDFTNVTTRKIVRFTPRMQQPCWGLPAVEEEFYWEGGQEKLLKRTEREYDLGGRVTSEKVYGADGLFAYSKAWDYDAHGNCLMERDALGQEIHRTYDANDNMLTEEGPRPDVRTVCRYDYSNRLIEKRLEGPGEVYVEQYGYNYLGHKVSEIDHFGNETRFSYDRFGNCVKKISPPIINKHPDGSVEALELSESWAYNGFGQMVAATDVQGLTTKFSYTVTGEKTRVEYPDGTNEQFYYAPDGKLEEEWGRTGIGKRHYYDALGHKIKEELLDRNAEVVATTSYVYVRDQLQKVIDVLGNATLYFYDGAGRLVREQRVDKDGVCVADARRVYDSLGRVQAEVQGVGEGATVTAVERDLLDRVVEQRVETLSGIVQQLVRTTYDEVGNPIEVLKEGVYATTTSYDIKNRPIVIVDPVGAETCISYDEEYLNEGHQKVLKKETRDPLGQLQIVIHNSHGEPVCIQTYTPEGEACGIQETVYRKDKLPRTVLQRVYVNGEEMRQVVNEWEYDAFGRVCAVIDGKGTEEETVTCKSYTPYGELSAVIRPSGIILHHLYDSLGRVECVTSSDESIHYAYHYDALGNLVEMEDCIHRTSTKRTYDALKRIVREELQNGFVVERAFDMQGRTIKTTYSNGKEVAYTYQGSELREVQGVGKATYKALYQSYNLSGQLTHYQGVGKSGSEQFEYDALGRFLKQTGPLFSEEVRGYDLAGNIEAIETKDPLGIRVVDYDYGPKYQLIKEGTEHTYHYDSLSNRLKKDGQAEKVNALNQVLESGSASYKYDKNGNLIFLNKENEEWTFSYDALDRLIAANGKSLEDKVSVEIAYLYDGFNRCIGRVAEMELAYCGRELGRMVEKSSVDYLYDGIREIGSCDDKGAMQDFRFLSPSGKAIALELPKSTYAPVYNFRGDLVVLVNPKTGKSAGTTRYSAFGEESGSTLSPWRFQNKRIDPLTNFYNFGRRWYAPTLARWITRDPLSYAAGPNLYAYVDNRPLLFVDVQGLYATKNKGPHGGGEVGGFNIFLYRNDQKARVERIGDHQKERMVSTFVNGMANTLDEARASTRLVSNHVGGQVTMIFDPKRGLAGDFGKYAKLQLGGRTEACDLLVDTWTKNYQEHGENCFYIHHCHSNGATTTLRAADFNPMAAKKICVVAVAPAVIIPDGIFRDAVNIVHRGDPVGRNAVDNFSRYKAACFMRKLEEPTANIVYIGSIWDPSHSFNEGNYQKGVRKYTRNFINEYCQ